MSSLYFLLLVGTLLFPVLLSFDKKVQYFKSWKWVLLSALIVAIPYLIWDQIFTQNGFWGFNENYLSGIYLADLPIEEVLFFIVVPFACTFIYECVRYYFRNFDLKIFNLFFYLILALYTISLLYFGPGKWYTLIAVSFGLVLIIYLFLTKKAVFLPLAFTFSIVPFLLVNGVLTGSGLDAPIVWYNEAEFSGLRILTIPFEDIVYSWGLIATNMLMFKRLKGYSFKVYHA